jgi:predicted phosphodiesterase
LEEYTLRGKDLLYILALGDIHRGNPGCNYQFLDYWLEMVGRIKNPKLILLMGDLIELASKSVGNSSFKQDMSVDEQLIQTWDFLEPYNKDIRFALVGNHGLRPVREFDLDVTRLLAHRIGCGYGHQYLETFMINDQPFTVYANHGKGTNAYAHLAQGKLIRETNQIQADLFIQGHNHRLDFFTQPLRSTDSPTGMKRRYYSFSGHFLNYDGYPDQMFLPPLPPAFQFITVDKHLNVWNIPYYMDIRRPDLMEDFFR